MYGYAHMGPPVDQLGDIWDDIGKGIDAAKSVKDVIAGHTNVYSSPYPVPAPGPYVPLTQAQPTILGMSQSAALWLGVGTLALLVFLRRR